MVPKSLCCKSVMCSASWFLVTKSQYMFGFNRLVWGSRRCECIKSGNLAGSRMKKKGKLRQTQSQSPSLLKNLTAMPFKSRTPSDDPRSKPVVERRTTHGVFLPTPSSMSTLQMSEMSSVTCCTLSKTLIWKNEILSYFELSVCSSAFGMDCPLGELFPVEMRQSLKCVKVFRALDLAVW